MLCLRALGFLRACTYRLMRRHSTAVLVVILIICLIFFHLYGHKHYHRLYSERVINDYNYRPGSFLKGQLPNKSVSYCRFNYGLPNSFKLSNVKVQPSPEIGHNSPFRVIYNAIKGSAYANVNESSAVTYVTHATPEFIYHIVEIARYWDGPISLAVYVPDYDLDIAMQIMNQLCHCYHNMTKVSLHLFYSTKYPPKLTRDPRIKPVTVPPKTNNITAEEILKQKIANYRNLTNSTRAEYIQTAIKKKIANMMVKISQKRTSAPYLRFPDCSGLETYDIPTFRRVSNIVYPVNVGRNVARNATRTNYFIVSDIEMVPSDGLAPKFLEMTRKLIHVGGDRKEASSVIPNTVFVVPLFEVEKGERIPRDKDTLRALVEDDRAMYFHQKICVHCQRFPGLQKWLSSPSPRGVEPLLITRREYPYHRWEPIYFGSHREPWYSEMLSWEGQQDKMTQMLELCLRGYRMVILDGAFLCHAARRPQDRSQYRIAEIANNKHYEAVIESFKSKYEDNPQCKVDWGFPT